VTISPLPQFEADLAEYLKEKEDREAYEKLNAPSSIVVRFGYSMMVGEFPYSGEVKPGCGSKLVVKTQRGTEIGEMLTSTCRNSGCSKSVSRKEMLEYIENSGGRKYPFYEQGRVMRVASKEDLDEQARLEQSKHGMRTMVRGRIKAHGLDMRLVEVEPILGGERVMVYFSAEDRVDFRELVKDLQVDLKNRVELVQVGSRDEARIVADYERCGQYCCCKNFLKVLKPISMKSAKIQKATLDPLKISGRCGRLMCCLRYEDETYEQLRKNLPHRKSRVGTPEGDGIVIDSQILTQLSKIKLDDGTIVAIPIEELTEPKLAKAPEADERVMRREPRGDRRRGEAGSESNESSSDERKRKRRRRRTNDEDAEQASGFTSTRDSESEDAPAEDGVERPRKRRRRRSKKRTNRGSDEGSATTQSSSGDSGSDSPSASGSGSDSDGSSERSGPKKKRRRRRRRRGGSGDGGAGDGGSGGGDS
jgi:cell fate regulator YaaT (PSP1 superfamily)